MKLYCKLRGKLSECGMSQAELGYNLDRDTQTINNRMTGRAQWTSCEMYGIMDLFHLPYTDLHIYFPKNGKEATP